MVVAQRELKITWQMQAALLAWLIGVVIAQRELKITMMDSEEENMLALQRLHERLRAQAEHEHSVEDEPAHHVDDWGAHEGHADSHDGDAARPRHEGFVPVAELPPEQIARMRSERAQHDAAVATARLGRPGTSCNCAWAAGGANCGPGDGSRCYQDCCTAGCSCAWAGDDGADCGGDDGSLCYGQCCGAARTTAAGATVAHTPGAFAARVQSLSHARAHRVGPDVSPLSGGVAGAPHAGWAVEPGGGGSGSLERGRGGGFTLTGDTRAYVVKDSRRGAWAEHEYLRFDLRKQVLSFNLDLSRVPCGCLACVYLVAMPDPSESGSSYCDSADAAARTRELGSQTVRLALWASASRSWMAEQWRAVYTVCPRGARPPSLSRSRVRVCVCVHSGRDPHARVRWGHLH